jgi:DNA-binding beta-propeller fold protein YncE
LTEISGLKANLAYVSPEEASSFKMGFKMKSTISRATVVIALLFPLAAHAEILAMANYESKPGQAVRREGIAIIDVDPNSPNFSKILADIPLPPDLVAHHIFYNKDVSKAYITALGSIPLQVMDIKKYPYRLTTIDTPDCKVGEDVVFSDDKKNWYLTCMGTSNVLVGDAQTDKVIRTITAPEAPPSAAFISHPHGIGLQDDIDRIIVSSTVRPSDLGAPGETVTVIEAKTGKVLSTHKLSDKPSPSGVAPVEAVFLPNANPPLAYITTMFGNTLWAATWNADTKEFGFQQVFDFAPQKLSVPLEIYFNRRHDRMYVTTASPGHLSEFDISTPLQPKLLRSVQTAEGAHHVVFSPDERYAFVQNSFLNLPNMRDGSISVIDLNKFERVASVDILKQQGFNPNCIILLPEWQADIRTE